MIYTKFLIHLVCLPTKQDQIGPPLQLIILRQNIWVKNMQYTLWILKKYYDM